MVFNKKWKKLVKRNKTIRPRCFLKLSLSKAVRNIYLIIEIIEKNKTVNTKEIEIKKLVFFLGF